MPVASGGALGPGMIRQASCGGAQACARAVPDDVVNRGNCGRPTGMPRADLEPGRSGHKPRDLLIGCIFVTVVKLP